MPSAADIFRQTLSLDASLVATIDHPYPSPPIHLFDGHLRLCRNYGDEALLLNWDVSQPDDRKYRYDLLTDTGLIAKNRGLYHYTPAVCYAEQTLDPRPFPLLEAALDVAVRAICQERRLASGAGERLLERAQQALQLAKAARPPAGTPWDHTRALLVSYYTLLDQPKLASYVAAHYVPYFGSPITTRWIPWCIRNTTGRLSFSVVADAGLFQRDPLRAMSRSNVDPATPGADAATMIEEGAVIPSLDVFLWSLAVGGIRHYGNDRGFLGALAQFVGDPGIAALQVTKEKEDCRRFLQLDKDYAVPVNTVDSTASIRTGPRQAAKLTRITSFSSLLVLAGADAFTDYVARYGQGCYVQETVSLKC